MRPYFIRQVASLAAVAGVLCCAGAARASFTIAPGWDLLTTAPGTTFLGAPFVGVPLGTYDFGGLIGVQNVGGADTIVERMASATGPGTAAPIPIELVALQLVSAMPIDPGPGLDLYYLTLQSARPVPGTPSVGQMTVTFGAEGSPHGTFDSFFDVYFDLRKGSLTGPIVNSSNLPLNSSGTPWSHQATPGSPLIPGANYFLSGSDTLQDFFPGGTFAESHPSGTHVVTSTPEPAAAALFAIGLGATALRRRRAVAARHCES